MIAYWIETSFNTEWAERFLKDERFRAANLPADFSVEDGRIVDNAHGSHVVYPAVQEVA